MSTKLAMVYQKDEVQMQNDLSSYLQGEIIDYLVIIHKFTLQLSMNKKTNTIFLTFQDVFNIIENCMILSTVMWYYYIILLWYLKKKLYKLIDGFYLIILQDVERWITSNSKHDWNPVNWICHIKIKLDSLKASSFKKTFKLLWFY